MKINFGLGPNGPRVGQGDILKVQPVQPSNKQTLCYP
jgi:hypothetical protein